jgi:hypothetical protein
MTSSVQLTADVSPDPAACSDAWVGRASPSRRTEREAWSAPLVIAAIWWGLVLYACGQALLAGE